MKHLIFLFAFCFCAYGQEAYVVQLSPEDASHAKQVYERMIAAQKDWAAVQKQISEKYLTVEPKDPEASQQHYTPATEWSLISNPSSATTFNGMTGEKAVQCADGRAPTDGFCFSEQDLAKYRIKKKEADEQIGKERRIRKGWNEEGIENMNNPPRFDFTHDFKFIVPAKPEPAPANPCGGAWITPASTDNLVRPYSGAISITPVR